MAVKITSVEPGSPARRARIHKGDTLISINGNPITDVLDYRFYMTFLSSSHTWRFCCATRKKRCAPCWWKRTSTTIWDCSLKPI